MFLCLPCRVAAILHHLVLSAGALVYEVVAEMEGGLVNHQGFLVREQFLAAAVLWDEAIRIARRKRRKGLQER